MIVPLGYNCGLTFLNTELHIKKETGLFEYFHIEKLQYVTDVINTLTQNPQSNVVLGRDRYVYLLNPSIYTCHYDIDEFKKIFQRRYNRFIDNINNNKNLFFVRINPFGHETSFFEIYLFIKSIKIIKPDIKFNFLLIDTIDNDSDISYINLDIDNVKFHHKHFYQKDPTEAFCTGGAVNPNYSKIYIENYKKILQDIGYDINDTNNIIFDDKS